LKIPCSLLPGLHYIVVAVDVRYFGDSLFDFKWAFKKLPKSIPKALKKDLTESKDMKIRHQLIKAKYF